MSNAALEHDAMALTRETELDFGLTIDAAPFDHTAHIPRGLGLAFMP